MDLATIEVPVAEAKRRLKEYEEVLAEERTVEDTALAAAYRAASRGLPVIRLKQAIETGGFFENGLPKLAVVRADATQCWVQTHRDEIVYGDTARAINDSRGALVGDHTVRVRVASPGWKHGKTVVPIIPPRHRPRRRRLRGFHILWEVEEWTPMPPVDPALIRHIRGDLWSVVATWNLTELERAVLSARIS